LSLFYSQNNKLFVNFAKSSPLFIRPLRKKSTRICKLPIEFLFHFWYVCVLFICMQFYLNTFCTTYNSWGGLLRHVEAVITELQASNAEGGFDAVGKTVSKFGDDGSTVLGRIIEVVEGEEENTLFWSVLYDDGSAEAIPFDEISERIVHNEEEEEEEEEDGKVAAASPGGKVNGGLGLESVEALNAVATFALSWLNYRGNSGLMKLDAPEAMLNTAILLHDILFELSGLDGVACQEVKI
jgi:hypothetical protein